ncbi:allulose-6-phosphate 3-epimerase [Thermoanaerobacterium thermosaccharolyticum]|uniref:Allulose-6-phosphate 3-epimerase n=1 Tax=Thermoanaerobacterium thermosaccharolyticum TaxID=1517 RepID=A0A223HZI7_THETR|nr:D-allulose 6-phosphate 3-epimerase [Thermoanaerobacterium thermosaccharolyticum]AST57724.1 allulose-6-phosphate 3-epimerase [Thermoanaerobacterium thermosaccharolyticum]
MKPMFAPSLMCANFLDLKNQIEILNERADIYHIDIMDGHYVKNFALSPYLMEQLKTIAKIPMDAHLMVENPADFLECIAKSGATYISPHAETINKDAFRIMRTIKALGCKTGIVLNPATPVEYIKYYIGMLDKITILTVDAGFAGQTFINEMLDKIAEIKSLRDQNGYSYLIEVDGSCNEKTFKQLAEAGTDVFVVGSSGLFNLDTDLKVAWDKMMDTFTRCTSN